MRCCPREGATIRWLTVVLLGAQLMGMAWAQEAFERDHRGYVRGPDKLFEVTELLRDLSLKSDGLIVVEEELLGMRLRLIESRGMSCDALKACLVLQGVAFWHASPAPLRRQRRGSEREVLRTLWLADWQVECRPGVESPPCRQLYASGSGPSPIMCHRGAPVCESVSAITESWPVSGYSTASGEGRVAAIR